MKQSEEKPEWLEDLLSKTNIQLNAESLSEQEQMMEAQAWKIAGEILEEYPLDTLL